MVEEIISLTTEAGTTPTETGIPGVLMIQGDVPQHQLAAVYDPMVGVVVNGGKTLSIGSSRFHLSAPSYFVVPTDLPASGRVHPGKDGTPYLSVALRLNGKTVLELLKDLPESLATGRDSDEFSGCAATPEFLDAWVRLLRLRKRPADIPALAPAYEREILYHVLRGPQGWRLRQSCFARGKATGINKAVQWIRENFTRAIDIEPVAARVGMAVTTFHRQFKQVTGLSPIQFQKQLRLLEARKFMAYDGDTASVAAFKVGYESVSQFNREYSRQFGAPPGRDILNLRAVGLG